MSESEQLDNLLQHVSTLTAQGGAQYLWDHGLSGVATSSDRGTASTSGLVATPGEGALVGLHNNEFISARGPEPHHHNAPDELPPLSPPHSSKIGTDDVIASSRHSRNNKQERPLDFTPALVPQQRTHAPVVPFQSPFAPSPGVSSSMPPQQQQQPRSFVMYHPNINKAATTVVTRSFGIQVEPSVKAAMTGTISPTGGATCIRSTQTIPPPPEEEEDTVQVILRSCGVNTLETSDDIEEEIERRVTQRVQMEKERWLAEMMKQLDSTVRTTLDTHCAASEHKFTSGCVVSKFEELSNRLEHLGQSTLFSLQRQVQGARKLRQELARTREALKEERQLSDELATSTAEVAQRSAAMLQDQKDQYDAEVADLRHECRDLEERLLVAIEEKSALSLQVESLEDGLHSPPMAKEDHQPAAGVLAIPFQREDLENPQTAGVAEEQFQPLVSEAQLRQALATCYRNNESTTSRGNKLKGVAALGDTHFGSPKPIPVRRSFSPVLKTGTRQGRTPPSMNKGRRQEKQWEDLYFECGQVLGL